MKKTTLFRSLVLSAAFGSLFALTGCSGAMHKPEKKEMRKSEPASDHHPSETKEMYQSGKGEPRMKQSQPMDSASKKMPTHPQKPQHPRDAS